MYFLTYTGILLAYAVRQCSGMMEPHLHGDVEAIDEGSAPKIRAPSGKKKALIPKLASFTEKEEERDLHQKRFFSSFFRHEQKATQEPEPCSRPSAKADIQRFYEIATAGGINKTTDKVTGHHYEMMYGMFLMPLQKASTPPKIFEIGLGCDYPWGTGVSQKMWKSMFPQSEIWGADVNKECVEKSRKDGEFSGIHLLHGDQKDSATLDRWIQETGGGDFDVIIDDGGHSNLMIMSSFEKLFPKMKPGGLYFIEDMSVGRGAPWKDWVDDTNGKAVVVDVVKDWIEQLTVPQTYRKPVEHPLPAEVSFVFCQQEACVIGKDPGSVRPTGK